MDFEVARIALLLAGTAYLAWQDNRTSFMDERVLYAMIAAGMLLDIATLNANFIIASVGVAAVVVAAGWYFYKQGAIGGGDVLLVAAMHALLPQRPEITAQAYAMLMPHASYFKTFALEQVTHALPFAASAVVAASLLALVGAAAMYALALRTKKLKPDVKSLLLTCAATAAVMWFAWNARLPLPAVAMLLVAMASAIFLTAFRKQIYEEVIVKRITLKQIEDEDVLAVDLMPQNVVEKHGLQKLLDKGGLEKLANAMHSEKLKAVPVAKVLPRLGPYLLAGIVASLLIGDLVAFLMLVG